MSGRIIVSREFLDQQANQTKEAIHYLTGYGRMSIDDTLALQCLANICMALKCPITEDPEHPSQQPLSQKLSTEQEAEAIIP